MPRLDCPSVSAETRFEGVLQWSEGVLFRGSYNSRPLTPSGTNRFWDQRDEKGTLKKKPETPKKRSPEKPGRRIIHRLRGSLFYLVRDKHGRPVLGLRKASCCLVYGRIGAKTKKDVEMHASVIFRSFGQAFGLEVEPNQASPPSSISSKAFDLCRHACRI